ncbi:flagellar hook-length control protein FliK [Paenibacillus brevis]|uniref:Flagellar hook-length control protein FliK n=1 Tax=Paenibacillus brevis TaxID=2841508 RepID=A0ABS6FUF0_9BACL|nr:flagellar hook-length control protein FliK [Paenibacillus brevis]MBU5673097.1 flagellar hook-length control protein FliK [Paenibacillus brevis]
MSIGPIIRAMAGENKPGAPKTLELKSGQVVRGTVLSVSEDGQEAVLNVQGVKLHAALETPLQPGQTTLLQVQPQAEDGMMRLKPIQGAMNGELTGAGLSKALEALGLDNTPANRELLQMMQSAGIPLTKENLAQLSALNAQKPASVNLSEWIQSAGIALSRSLPLTAETVSGLHQAVFGPQLHVLLSSLEEQITSLLSRMNAQGAEGQQGPASGTALAQGTAANPAGSPLAQGEGAVNANAGRVVDGQVAGNMGNQPAPGMMTAASGSGLSQMQEEAAPLAAPRQAAATPVPAEGTALPEGGGRQMAAAAKGDGRELLQKLQQVLTELKGAALTEGGAAATAAAGKQAAAEGPMAAGMASAAMDGEAPAAASQAARPQPQTESWVGRVLKLLGAEHEQQVLRAAAADGKAAGAPQAQQATGQAAPGASLPPQAQQQATTTAAAQPAVATAAAQQAQAAAEPLPAQVQPAAAAALAFTDVGGEEAAAVRDTLKGLLLQAAAADQLPEPLREAARQIVQQLTGQQLLLTTDRTAPFAQVTMFLPFTGPNGEETASVQIEARRGRKGELDAANCRLWFDLQMKALGQLMVDVQVADRKVILRILAENETVGAYLETKNEEVEQALNGAGYQLLSLKTELLITSMEAEGSSLELGRSMTYAPSPYKGVDYRI